MPLKSFLTIIGILKIIWIFFILKSIGILAINIKRQCAECLLNFVFFNMIFLFVCLIFCILIFVSNYNFQYFLSRCQLQNCYFVINLIFLFRLLILCLFSIINCLSRVCIVEILKLVSTEQNLERHLKLRLIFGNVLSFFGQINPHLPIEKKNR